MEWKGACESFAFKYIYEKLEFRSLYVSIINQS